MTQNMFINSDTNLDNHELLDALSQIVRAGDLSMPRIDQTFHLNQIPQAFNASSSGHTVGKILITSDTSW